MAAGYPSGGELVELPRLPGNMNDDPPHRKPDSGRDRKIERQYQRDALSGTGPRQNGGDCCM